MSAQRFFRVADDATYENVRLSLDAAWGHPTADGTTITCIDPAAIGPRDANGHIVLAVDDAFCEVVAVAEMLPQLLASGAAVEITAAEYASALAAMNDALRQDHAAFQTAIGRSL